MSKHATSSKSRRKKVDARVRTLIENGVKSNHRSFFVVVGDRGRDQVPNLHYVLNKASTKRRATALWCYKNELGFSTHRQKRAREIKKLIQRGLYDPSKEDPFELFVASTKIRWCYYKDTKTILGSTVSLLVLQDFEAITPNLLARAIECVEGGGIVVMLLRTMNSLRQLYTMAMDVHSRFRTSAHQNVVPRFNERFILSLTRCKSCLVVDDELNVLPVSRHANSIIALPSSAAGGDLEGQAGEDEIKLNELKESLAETQPVGTLVEQARTLDQAQAIMTFIDAISEKTLRSTVALTAARGRGKSAALGIAIASAVAYGYSNIFVTAPSPENLATVFDFIFRGFDALKFKEHMDYEVIQSTNPDFNKAVVRVNVFRDHRQTIQYIHPSDSERLSQAELVVIDEAAAIPLPLVRALLGNYLVFMSSTVNGYEGTGRSLSLKLLSKLRQQQGAHNYEQARASTYRAGQMRKGDERKKMLEEKKRKKHENSPTAFLREDRQLSQANPLAGTAAPVATRESGGRILRELELKTPIRYASGDEVESWLHQLLCLDATSAESISKMSLVNGCPHPSDCELYCVNRDALFSYHSMSESFLQRMMALYVASHYKNSPNDLLLMSDAPAHRLFVLLGPTATDDGSKSSLPDILCVVQVALEGAISKGRVQEELGRGKRSSGDLIPWTLSQQFQDNEFASLSGARIVRIATHPDVMGMGYGSRAVDLLTRYYQGETVSVDLDSNSDSSSEESQEDEASQGSQLDTISDANLRKEKLRPRKKLPPLLAGLGERPAERLHYLGVSFGLTQQLFNFWRRKEFSPVYLRQTANELTGEFSCIMLRPLECGDMPVAPESGWLLSYRRDFMRRFVCLLASAFRGMRVDLSLSILDKNAIDEAVAVASDSQSLSKSESLDADQMSMFVSPRDLKRLEAYARNMVDNHMVRDLIPTIANMYFFGRLGGKEQGMSLSQLQCAILLGLGLQAKTIDNIADETTLPAGQLLAMFNKSVRKISRRMRKVFETAAADEIDESIEAAKARTQKKNKRSSQSKNVRMRSLDAEQAADATEAISSLNSNSQNNSQESLTGVLGEYAEYAVPDELGAMLDARGKTSVPQSISVKRKRPSNSNTESDDAADSKKKQKKPISATKKAKNKMKKQKKKARDRKKRELAHD